MYELHSTQQTLEKSLPSAVYQVSLKEHLNTHQEKVDKIEQIIPPKNKIGSIINSFKEEATKRNIDVKVPTVEEKMIKKNGSKPKKQEGPIRTISLKVNSSGEPISLVNYMHSMEHMPWLLRVTDFSLNTDSKTTQTNSLGYAPANNPPGSAEKKETKQIGNLTMEIKLIMSVEKQ